jgi:hypothetical protein
MKTESTFPETRWMPAIEIGCQAWAVSGEP